MRESLGTGHDPPQPHIEHLMCDRCTPIGILFLSSLLQGFTRLPGSSVHCIHTYMYKVSIPHSMFKSMTYVSTM